MAKTQLKMVSFVGGKLASTMDDVEGKVMRGVVRCDVCACGAR